MRARKFKPNLAREGFDDVIELARRWQLLVDRKGGINYLGNKVTVTLREPFIHEEGDTLEEAFTKAELALKEKLTWDKRMTAIEARYR